MKGTLALLAGAQAADIGSTWYALSHGAHEVGPFAVAIVGVGGWGLATYLKAASVPLVGVVLSLAPNDRARRRSHKAVQFVAAMVFGVAAWNVIGVVPW